MNKYFANLILSLSLLSNAALLSTQPTMCFKKSDDQFLQAIRSNNAEFVILLLQEGVGLFPDLITYNQETNNFELDCKSEQEFMCRLAQLLIDESQKLAKRIDRLESELRK